MQYNLNALSLKKLIAKVIWRFLSIGCTANFLFTIRHLRKWEGTNQEKSQELIIFYKKNNILYLFLRNLDFFVNFAGKVQYNTLLGMKIQEVNNKRNEHQVNR